MSRDQIYSEEIRPLMKEISKICKKHRIAFAAQFMMDEDHFYVSAHRKGAGRWHIEEVLTQMLFKEIDRYDQKVTRHGIHFNGKWYWSENLMMYLGQRVHVIPKSDSLEIFSTNFPVETIESFNFS